VLEYNSGLGTYFTGKYRVIVIVFVTVRAQSLEVSKIKKK
jgi:hypothetical protein